MWVPTYCKYMTIFTRAGDIRASCPHSHRYCSAIGRFCRGVWMTTRSMCMA